MDGQKILVRSGDYHYYETECRMEQVVYNVHTRTYSEYHGDMYLDPGDKVVERWVAQ
jgi:predicted RNA methylase